MAYTVPSKEDRSSPYLSPNSSYRSYFSNQPIHPYRSGYPAPADSRETEFQRYPTDLTDPVEREREKNRIRKEIMAEQLERRRILEEEIRMELMLEREVALKRWELSRMRYDPSSEIRQSVYDPLPMRSDGGEIRPYFHETSRIRSDAPETRQFVDEHSRMRYEAPEIHQFGDDHSRNRSDAPEVRSFIHELSRTEPSRIPQQSSHLDERTKSLYGMGSNHSMLPTTSGSSSFQHPSMLPITSSLILRDNNPTQRREDNFLLPSSMFQHHLIPPLTWNVVQEPRKERILLAKHEANLSDLNRKRKASTLGSDHRSSNLDKKPKGRWNCNLCKISTTSEKTLNDHLKGKKHQEALNPQNTPNTDKPDPRAHEKSSKAEKKLKGKMDEISVPQSTIVIKKQESKTDETKHAEVNLKENRPKRKMDGSLKIGEQSQRFKFWCGICQVGVTSQVTMFSHEKGRRHLDNVNAARKMKHSKVA